MNGQFTRTAAMNPDTAFADKAPVGVPTSVSIEELQRSSHDSRSDSRILNHKSQPGTRCSEGLSFQMSGRSRRKLAMLKRCGLFAEIEEGITVSRACSLDDLRGAYQLVHEVYIKTGYICPEPSRLRMRMFETSPETATFVAKKAGRIVGALSIVGDSKEVGLPSDTAFKSELDSLRAKCLRLAEATNQAIAEQFRSSALATELMRCGVAHLVKAGYDEAIAAVSPSHEGFYRLLNFRCVGSVRSYSEQIHDPVVALSMDVNHFRRAFAGLDEAEQFVHSYMTERNPFMKTVAGWDVNAKRRFLKAFLLRQLFVTETEFITHCSKSELHALELAWGQGLFARVTGVSLFTKVLKWVQAWLSVMNVHDDHPWLPIPARLPQ